MTSNDMETDDKVTQRMDVQSESSSDIEIESESEQAVTGTTTSKTATSTTNINQDTSKPQASFPFHNSILPLSRIKKIMKADPELSKCSPDSVLATAISTVRTTPLIISPCTRSCFWSGLQRCQLKWPR